jgi:NADH-quinone oxidoreductase subunit J
LGTHGLRFDDDCFRQEGDMAVAIAFYTLAILAVALGVVVVTRRSPISSAIALVASFFCLAGMYALLDAHFVAIIQVLVYAGAIMVLFIFVIMLLNLRFEGPEVIPHLAPRIIGGLGAVGLVGTGLVVAASALTDQPLEARPPDFGTIAQVGQVMFGGTYLLPFEVASALLTVAMIGAVVLGKRDI